MARGTGRAAEVSVRVQHAEAYAQQFTGTITELLSQPQPPMSTARCLSQMTRTVDRLDLESVVQQAT